MKHNKLLLAATVVSLSLSFHAQAGSVYKCKEESGEFKFQNTPCLGDLTVTTASDDAVSNDISPQSLVGRWAITQAGSMSIPESEWEEDVWVFTTKKMEVFSGGRGLRPDHYTIKDNSIDFGYSKIKVLDFDGSTMKVKTLGIVQHLKKLK